VGSLVRKALGLGGGKLRAQVLELDTEPVPGERDRALLHFDFSDRMLTGYAWDFPAGSHRRAGLLTYGASGGLRQRLQGFLDEALQDEHNLARGMVVEVEHPRFGPIKQVGIPAKFSETPGTVRSTAPLPGEHTDAVLADLGYAADRIADLRARGAIGP